MKRKPILELYKVTKVFDNSRRTFGMRQVSFNLEKGQVACLVGPSGAGKTTLLRALAGLEVIDNGKITFHTDTKQQVAFVFQDFNLWPHKTVLENIILAPTVVQHVDHSVAVKEAEQLLKKFGLFEKRNVYPDFLSGGQKQRVAIIRALAVKPAILVLDEITSALDPELVASVLELIKKLAREGQTMVIATHHLAFAEEVADTVLFLDKGRILQQAPPREFFRNQKDKRIQEFIKRLK